MITKHQLAIVLSKLKTFENPKPLLEQYSTDSNVAADILWNAFMIKDIEGKTIADLGAGTGILGIGCLELGAKTVHFVEKDKDVIDQLNFNLSPYDENFKVINKDVNDFTKKVDVVVMNPPFGVQKRKADKIFVKKAIEIAITSYYIGKVESKKFIESICKDHNKKITHFWEYKLPLKKTMKFHTKSKQIVNVGCWRIK